MSAQPGDPEARAVVAVELSVDELATIAQAARRAGLTLAGYLRHCGLESAMASPGPSSATLSATSVARLTVRQEGAP